MSVILTMVGVIKAVRTRWAPSAAAVKQGSTWAVTAPHALVRSNILIPLNYVLPHSNCTCYFSIPVLVFAALLCLPQLELGEFVLALYAIDASVLLSSLHFKISCEWIFHFFISDQSVPGWFK